MVDLLDFWLNFSFWNFKFFVLTWIFPDYVLNLLDLKDFSIQIFNFDIFPFNHILHLFRVLLQKYLFLPCELCLIKIRFLLIFESDFPFSLNLLNFHLICLLSSFFNEFIMNLRFLHLKLSWLFQFEISQFFRMGFFRLHFLNLQLLYWILRDLISLHLSALYNSWDDFFNSKFFFRYQILVVKINLLLFHALTLHLDFFHSFRLIGSFWLLNLQHSLYFLLFNFLERELRLGLVYQRIAERQ